MSVGSLDGGGVSDGGMNDCVCMCDVVYDGVSDVVCNVECDVVHDVADDVACDGRWND